MKEGNADALEPVEEYYPASKSVESGVENVTVGSDIESIEYYDLRGIRLAEPTEGLNIRRIRYSDGKIVTDKVIKR